MSSKLWAFRVVKFEDGYGFVEGHMDPDGVIVSWVDPTSVSETVPELADVLSMMQKALVEPVLDEEDLPK